MGLEVHSSSESIVQEEEEGPEDPKADPYIHHDIHLGVFRHGHRAFQRWHACRSYSRTIYDTELERQ
jgi:hypothetical protein